VSEGELFLYDDAAARRFEPFALTRPIAEMRAGAMLVRERWEYVYERAAAGVVTSPHLADFEEPGAAPVHGSTLPQGAVVANARFCPALARWSAADAWRNEGRVVALTLPRPVEIAELQDGRVSLDDLVPEAARVVESPGLWMEHVWDYIGRLPHMLTADVDVISKTTRAWNDHGSHTAVSGPHGVYAETDAEIEPHVYFDTTAGPVLLRRGATVQAFTRLVGPCVVGEESVVGVDKITGSSIGDHCKIHGELSTSIIIGHSNKSHDGFVGHSYLGRWVNLGAGTITSNLKNTYGHVSMWTHEGERDTGLQFLGTMFGDHVKTGIGATLNTGSVIGAGANVFGTGLQPKVISPFCWGDRLPYSTYELRKFLDVAKRVMERRKVTLTSKMETTLARAHERRWTVMSAEKKK
jgi:UDP-N-acetylglucosamine diphosphorylase / glucose-1-phosphate thymidylyltransferase / UDP-N-acetylgalactosamine diphosphorylase / glucosamine-1-phosphate N-acetyltransferase / galactosamine-1-phosphate N-acetyltransferase